ncbi:MAG: hypothetical protein K2M80_04285 [Muribaculaceae bacterium]|nr:hypothetical protein [Muribaculaceae bacterium]
MTDELREILLAKMLDNPRELTADQLASIESDGELRELYSLALAVAGSSVAVPGMDVDAGWDALKPRLATKPKKRFNLSASVIGAAAAVTLLVVAIAGVILNPQLPSESDIALITSVDDQHPAQLSIAEIKRHFSASLPTTESVMAKVVTITPEPEVTLEPPEPPEPEVDEQFTVVEIDPEELIRIEEARLDNEVAMAIADVYRTELQNQLDIAAAMIDNGLADDDASLLQQLRQLNYDKYLIP